MISETWSKIKAALTGNFMTEYQSWEKSELSHLSCGTQKIGWKKASDTLHCETSETKIFPPPPLPKSSDLLIHVRPKPMPTPQITSRPNSVMPTAFQHPTFDSHMFLQKRVTTTGDLVLESDVGQRLVFRSR